MTDANVRTFLRISFIIQVLVEQAASRESSEPEGFASRLAANPIGSVRLALFSSSAGNRIHRCSAGQSKRKLYPQLVCIFESVVAVLANTRK
jgi:hypothetical protein